jgi:hypothetical protein
MFLLGLALAEPRLVYRYGAARVPAKAAANTKLDDLHSGGDRSRRVDNGCLIALSGASPRTRSDLHFVERRPELAKMQRGKIDAPIHYHCRIGGRLVAGRMF